MSFALAGFVPASGQANSNVPRVYMYISDDLIAAIIAADYFLAAYKHLQVGDIIIVRADDDGNASFHELWVLTSSFAGVTVALKTSQELTVSGAVTPGVMSVELSHASTAVLAVIADAKAHQGLLAVVNTSSGGTEAHTLTLTAGTFNGTNNVATLNAPLEALVVWIDSAGNGTIIVNVGSVALS